MYSFDAKETKEQLIKWIQDFFAENGPGCNAVIAISGGKDSSVVAALCVEALGRDRVYGVLMPNGEQADIDASKLLVSHLGISHSIVNIKKSFDGLIEEIKENISADITKQTVTNLPARLRMATTYAVAQSMNGRVANTCNLSEDWVGYSTRYGDAAGDFSPLANLTVQEVLAVGMELNLPKELVYKTPIDGLSGLSDEENLGFTYEVLDRYIRTGICDDMQIKEKIDMKRKSNKFKLELMPSFKYKGPIMAKDI